MVFVPALSLPDNLIVLDFDRSDHHLITDRDLSFGGKYLWCLPLMDLYGFYELQKLQLCTL